jgi:hypothetical protein
LRRYSGTFILDHHVPVYRFVELKNTSGKIPVAEPENEVAKFMKECCGDEKEDEITKRQKDLQHRGST